MVTSLKSTEINVRKYAKDRIVICKTWRKTGDLQKPKLLSK